MIIDTSGIQGMASGFYKEKIDPVGFVQALCKVIPIILKHQKFFHKLHKKMDIESMPR